MRLFAWLFPTPYQIAQRSFAKRIATARAKHHPIRHIQKEQREWLNNALAGGTQKGISKSSRTAEKG